MTPNLSVRDASAMATVLAEQVDLIRRTIAKDATSDELQLYFYDCARQGVHPLDKLIHFTKRGGRYVPITSIDFMRMRAGKTGEYAGCDDAVFTGTPAGKGFAATVTVHRFVHDQRCAWSATARWEEYFPGPQQGATWAKMPHVMLAKCAEALALRKAFADVLHGLYIREEMDQADVTPKKDTRSLREKVGLTAGPADPDVLPSPVAAPEPMTTVQAAMPEPAKPAPSALRYPFGQCKGQPITDVPDESLQFWMDRMQRDLEDANKKRFWEKTRGELVQVQAEFDRRVREAFTDTDEPTSAFASAEEWQRHLDPPAEDLTLQ